ncbi:MAG: hypothetical protein NTY15_08315 [Planctomycetota bacterium]|nr:hypothetical protein [Planctomycetota bacterium]
MSQVDTSLEMVASTSKARCCNWTLVAYGVLAGIALSVVVGTAFWLGRESASASSQSTWNGIARDKVPTDLLAASATHGGANMAVCTAQVGDDAEGFFALDFITGDLKGWVYYPKMGRFGGLFMTNVKQQLGQSKNPEYLLVSGGTFGARLGGNVKLAQSLIYVVDTRSGQFAAYSAPWNSAMENSSGTPQMSQMILMDFSQIRDADSGAKKPMAPMPGAAGPGKPGAADPNKPANQNNKK